MKKFFVTVIVVLILFQSCAPKKPNLVTCDLKKTDYTDVIHASGSIQAVNSTNLMAPRNYYGSLKVARAVPQGSHVEAGDTVCVLECAPMMQMLDQELRNLESLKADFKKLEADNALNRAMLDARMKENKAGMAISQLDSVQILFAPPLKQKLMALELEKSHILEKKLQKKDEAEKKIDETEIRQLNSRIIQAENRVKMMQEQVGGLSVVAPKSGVVTKSDGYSMVYMMSMDGTIVEMGGYPKPGSQIFPEMPLMSLPELDEMQVSVEVREGDFKRIEKGQSVEIVVDAAGSLRTTGSVKRKSMAGKIDYYTDSRVKWYEVIVSVDSCHNRLQPGLSARCDIFVNRIRDTIVVPTLAIFQRDSMKVVYVADGDKFRPVPVETGFTNSSQTIITKGLTGTETISLMEPPQNFIEKKNKSTNE